MKKILLLFALLGASFATRAEEMKMIVDPADGTVMARYVSQKGNVYIGSVQEEDEYSVARYTLVTFKPENGQGICYRDPIRTGNINVRKAPTTSSDVVAKIPDEDMPECYECLGKTNGWYKIRINGRIGYVREDMAIWDGLCTF